MEWHTFLDAQLWLRRVPATEFEWPQTNEQLDSLGLRQLFPPPKVMISSQSEPSSEQLTSWCCFHEENRFCFFHSSGKNEDQSQVEIEVCLGENIYLRFGRMDMFQANLRMLQSVKVPERNASSQTTRPPFGTLNFGSVKLRIWIDPSQSTPQQARHYLLDSMRLIEVARGREEQFHKSTLHGVMNPRNGSRGTWQDSFRHNQAINPEQQSQIPIALSPSALVERASKVFLLEADQKALKMVIERILDDRRASANAVVSQQSPVSLPNSIDVDHALSQAECFFLATELIRILGEDHQHLSMFLGIACRTSECESHEGCLKSDSSPKRSCITTRWQQWDEFLDLSERRSARCNKRQRIQMDHLSENMSQGSIAMEESDIQEAATAMVQSIVNANDAKEWRHAHCESLLGLERYEHLAFSMLDDRHQATNAPGESNSSASRLHEDIERMWSFLLERRRALVRQHLAFNCLPQPPQLQDMGH